MAMLAIALWARAAHAQPSNEALAEALFREGVERLAANAVVEACAKLAESQRLDPQVGTLLNLARCHEREGKTATAWSEYSQVVDRARRAGDSARVTYAAERVAALEPTLAHLRIVVPAGLRLRKVSLDGTELGAAAWSAELPVDPGRHEVALEPERGRPWTQLASVAPGARVSVDAVPPPTAEAPSPVAESTPPLRMAGMIALAGGAVATGFAVYAGLTALHEKNVVERECNGAACSRTGLDAERDARTLGTASTILFVAAGALVASGVVCFVLGTKQTAPVSLALRF